MAEKFPNLMKDMNIYIQDVQQTASMVIKKTTSHLNY